MQYAGQGEFPRFIVAPADPGEAYHWSAAAIRLSWKYQIPAFVLTDKTLSEGSYSVDYERLMDLPSPDPVLWDGQEPYRRYVSPRTASPLSRSRGRKDAVVKVNSYAHDEDGITTEDAGLVTLMTEKRRKKEAKLKEEMSRYPCVSVRGTPVPRPPSSAGGLFAMPATKWPHGWGCGSSSLWCSLPFRTSSFLLRARG